MGLAGRAPGCHSSCCAATEIVACSSSNPTVTASDAICFQITRHILLWCSDSALVLWGMYSPCESCCSNIKEKGALTTEASSPIFSSARGKLNMQIGQRLRTVKGQAGRKTKRDESWQQRNYTWLHLRAQTGPWLPQDHCTLPAKLFSCLIYSLQGSCTT